MQSIKQYKITLKSQGRITQLPDSQQLFGALVYLFSEKSTAKKASEFVDDVKNQIIGFTLSSLMPSGYFPVPQTYLQNQVENNKQLYKSIKKRQYISKELLGKVLQNVSELLTVKEYASIHESQQVHASIDSLRYDLPGLSPNLYAVPEITVVEQRSQSESRVLKNFEFYFTLANGHPLIMYIQQAKEEGRLFILGPRSSQGLNMYVIEAIQEDQVTIQTTENDLFLNMGRLLPRKINFEQSFLKLYTSERRPYQNYEDRNQKTTKQFISFIDSGSFIKLPKKTDIFQAGQSIASPFDSSGKSITFGQSFLYPLAMLGGCSNE